MKRMRKKKSVPALIDFIQAGRRVEHHVPWRRAVVAPKSWNLAVEQLAEGRWSLLGLWGEPGYCPHGASRWKRPGHRRRQPEMPGWPLPVGRSSASARIAPRACGRGPVRTAASRDCRIRGGGLITASGASAIRWEQLVRRPRRRLPTASCPPRVRACIRSRSGPCMPASSSRGIFDLRRAAKRSSGWRSVSDTCTRA